MSWTYSKPSGEIVKQDGGWTLHWVNSFTLRELTPTAAGCIRLEVKVETQSYWAWPNDNYVPYSEDRISCGGSCVTVSARSAVGPGYGYTKTVQLPSAWAGQTVRLEIAWTDVSVRFDASPNAPSTVSASDGFFGQALPLTIRPSLSGVTHTLTVSCLGRTETVLSDSAALTASWTPALEVYAPLLTNAGSTTASFTCRTKSGSTELGSSTKSVTLRFRPEDLRPVLEPGWVTVSPYNSGAAASFSCLIRGYSAAEAVFDSAKVDLSGSFGATLAGFRLRHGASTRSTAPYRSGVLYGESEELCVSAVDSRGQESSETLTLHPFDYAPPTLSEIRVFRSDAQGVEDEDGSCLAFRATANITSLNGENTAALSCAARERGGSWSGETAMSSGALCLLSGWSPDRNLEARISLEDALGGTASALRTLPQRKWAMKFRANGEGVGFGKAPEHARSLELPSGWQIRIGDEALWETVYPVGAVYLSAVNTSPAALFGGSWESVNTAIGGVFAWKRVEVQGNE